METALGTAGVLFGGLQEAAAQSATRGGEHPDNVGDVAGFFV